LFALTWADVAFRQGMLRIVHTKNGGQREIPMTDTPRNTLQVLPHQLHADAVFPRTSAGIRDILRRFHRALHASGIEGFVFHDLRHTFASHLVMAGVDLLTVNEFLGHKDLSMTLRY
jgi:integrase